MDELINIVEEKVKENGSYPYLLDIDTSHITSMRDLFCNIPNADNIEILDLSAWNTSNVKDMSHLF